MTGRLPVSRRARAVLAGMALAAGLLPLAQAASFPCDKARSAVERRVCASAELSDLDEYLGRYHEGARHGFGHAQRCYTDDQRLWLRTVRDACRDDACLKQAYLERLAVLHAIQPGATRLRVLELPRVPPLVWIVAPAADQVAAPRNQATRPFVARGRIVDDVVNGDGHVLQIDAKGRIVIQSLMLLEQPTADALAALARLPGAVFEVRGRIDAQATAAKAFAAGHCAYVYRVSP